MDTPAATSAFSKVPLRLHDGFDEPAIITDALLAFPGDVRHLMPPHHTVPAEFTNMNAVTEWNRFVSHWLFTGNPLKVWDLHLHPEIDGGQAFRHLTAISRSFQPKHEHKEAALAWLLSRWFTAITPTSQTPSDSALTND